MMMMTWVVLLMLCPVPAYAQSKCCDCDPGNATVFRDVSRLRGILTGIERSGTTILSQLVMSSPEVFGGFECGLLLTSNPREFRSVNPFYEWMTQSPLVRMWALNPSDLEHLCATATCHAEFYAGLRRLSPILNESHGIIDKTPRYIYHLGDVMRRSPGVPVVVIRKTKDELLRSWNNRAASGQKVPRDPLNLLSLAGAELAEALETFPDRILTIQFGDLISNPNATMHRVFDFLGLEWKYEYVKLEAYNAKFAPFGTPPVGPLRSQS
ncbi:hypothetical protein CTAYLR_007254 [Chrysophaeum taylorii]|uniref:Sulfotransferase n=1 Tax=Chrysophaeum taylorii TaxID=2483200 RepID=A0AAD7UB56_9STRA|nr:hypothetical protein CTAYLR_007254 [Chrysophaeum taylorii]